MISVSTLQTCFATGDVGNPDAETCGSLQASLNRNSILNVILRSLSSEL